MAVGKEGQAGDVNVLHVGVVLQDCLHITWGHLHIVPVSHHPQSDSVSIHSVSETSTNGFDAAKSYHTLSQQNSP